jgi:hypothetical protein
MRDADDVDDARELWLVADLEERELGPAASAPPA